MLEDRHARFGATYVAALAHAVPEPAAIVFPLPLLVTTIRRSRRR